MHRQCSQSSTPLITNFSCSYSAFARLMCVCLSFSDKSQETQDRKKHPLTYHLQGCYLAEGQEEKRVTRVPTSELNRDELPHPFFPSPFYSSFPFILVLPPSPHTRIYQEVSHFRWLLDRFGVCIARVHLFKNWIPSLESLSLKQWSCFKYAL